MLEFLEKYWWQLGVLLIAIITTFVKVKELEKRLNDNEEKTNKCYEKMIVNQEEMKHINSNFEIVNRRIDKTNNNLSDINKEIDNISKSVIKTETIITEIFKKFNN